MAASHFSLGKDKIKFVLLEGVSQTAVASLHDAGYTNIDYVKTALAEDELIERVKDAHFIGLRSRTQLTRNVFAHAQKLIGVGCFCIGTNQVDLAAAGEHGVAVFNAPFSNTRSVAELVIAEAILLLRDIPAKNAGCHRGEWSKSADGSFEIRGKTLGLVGYGSIGSQISVLAEGLGMHVLFYDVVSKLPLGNAAQCKTLPELLSQSDIVSLHVPETPATKNMIAAAELAAMKPNSILINASRGTVIDIDALAAALASRHLAGAAIDVFPVEPKGNAEEFVSPLRAFDNVILTPHIGGSTMEAQENIGVEVAEKLIKYSDNGTTTSSVNFPEVALPSHHNVHRLLHVHQNIPGVLTAINLVFSANNINIASQYLQTNEKVGYVVIDVESEYSEVAVQQLREIAGTIRCRVLF
ncbi:phosphoglycerate dehydrogenase [Teredinibacter waterburyi]|jgi:D-3-phosphoglycerate dehydrogenase (EC 1.1.1.95)|uniref:phosphoglycerate dehydrogenase n=1 Tax=Teredinibacter waterburyi TaxID=1500538 RepID=UPI00165F6568|nr:phosphoglycerate dehydrogenase [Teredinibacter waterburyi]